MSDVLDYIPARLRDDVAASMATLRAEAPQPSIAPDYLHDYENVEITDVQLRLIGQIIDAEDRLPEVIFAQALLECVQRLSPERQLEIAGLIAGCLA